MNASKARIVVLTDKALGKDTGSPDETADMDETPGWDSLKTIEAVVTVERHFSTTFAANQMMTLDSAPALQAALVQNGTVRD